MVALHVCQVWWTLAYKPLRTRRHKSRRTLCQGRSVRAMSIRLACFAGTCQILVSYNNCNEKQAVGPPLTDMPPTRPATEASSGSLEPGLPNRARSTNTCHPAGWPHMPPADRMYTTDVRQHHCLMLPGQMHNNEPTEFDLMISIYTYVICKYNTLITHFKMLTT